MSLPVVPDPLSVARAYFADRGSPAHLVGGQVRDLVLGRSTADTDIAVPEGAIAHARAIARASGGAFVILDAERDVGRVVWPASGPPLACLDIARYTGPDLAADLSRRDFTINAMALPLSLPLVAGAAIPARTRSEAGAPEALEGLTLENLERFRGVLVDPSGGLADLAAGRIRMTGTAALDDDPLRLLRAPRFAAELGFEIEPETAAAIRARAAAIRQPAGERVQAELLRIVAVDGTVRQILGLDDLGLLDYLLPEVAAGRGVQQSPPHDRDVFDHTLGVLAGVERIQALLAGQAVGAADADAPLYVPSAWDAVLIERRAELSAHFAATSGGTAASRVARLRLAALFHDIGKPVSQHWDAERGRYRYLGHDQVGTDMVRAIATRLRLASTDAAYLETVVQHHMRPLHLMQGNDLSDRAIYRYYLATGPIGVDIAVLSLADNAAKAGRSDAESMTLARVVSRLLGAWFDEHARVVAPPPLVSGHDLMAALGLGPGPDIGRLLAAVREAQAAGEVGDRAAALALAQSLWGAQS